MKLLHCVILDDVIFSYSPGAEGGPVCNHMSPNFDSIPVGDP